MAKSKAVAKSPTAEKSIAQAPSDSPYQLDNAQVLKASKALLKYVSEKKKEREQGEGRKPNLLEDLENPTPETIWLNLTMKKLVSDTKRLKPARILLPHPLRDIPNTTICLIVKDPQRTYKDLISTTPALSNVKKVVGVSKLRAKFKTFESRRLLADSYDLFLADDRVVCMLPGILGKTFYGRSTKIPIPLSVAKERIESEVGKCLKATYLNLNAAASSSLRVGLSSFTPEMVSENVAAAVEKVVVQGKGMGKVGVPGGWRGLKSLHLKSPESAALPIWLAQELYEAKDVLRVGEKEKLAAEAVQRKEEIKERRKKRKAKKRRSVISRKQE